MDASKCYVKVGVWVCAGWCELRTFVCMHACVCVCVCVSVCVNGCICFLVYNFVELHQQPGEVLQRKEKLKDESAGN